MIKIEMLTKSGEPAVSKQKQKILDKLDKLDLHSVGEDPNWVGTQEAMWQEHLETVEKLVRQKFTPENVQASANLLVKAHKKYLGRGIVFTLTEENGRLVILTEKRDSGRPIMTIADVSAMTGFPESAIKAQCEKRARDLAIKTGEVPIPFFVLFGRISFHRHTPAAVNGQTPIQGIVEWLAEKGTTKRKK